VHVRRALLLPNSFPTLELSKRQESGVFDLNWITNYVRPKINSMLGRREVPENLWIKCPETGEMVFHKDLEDNKWVIPASGYHMKMPAKARLPIFSTTARTNRCRSRRSRRIR
jgi:acetyl-CoA carboxylase beta subunit